MAEPRIYPSASDPREIILMRYQDALGVGISKYPNLPTEKITLMFDKGEADGDVETRLVIGPTLGVPLYQCRKFYVFTSVHRYFSRQSLFEPVPAPAVRRRPASRGAPKKADWEAIKDLLEYDIEHGGITSITQITSWLKKVLKDRKEEVGETQIKVHARELRKLFGPRLEGR